MAIKIKKTSSFNGFYPTDSKKYVYLTSLSTEGSEEAQKTYEVAKNLVSSTVSSFSTNEKLDLAFSNLLSLAEREREAENQFLSTQLKINLQEVQAYGFKQLIDSFNSILNLESTYRSNIEKVKMMSEENSSGWIDRLYTITNYELPAVVEKTLQGILGKDLEHLEGLMTGMYDEQIRSECAEALAKALREKYAIGTEGDKYYAEFAQMMRSLTARSPLIQNIMRNYGLSGEQLRTSVISKQKANKAVNISNIYLQRRGGNVYEDFVQRVLSSIESDGKTVAINTGALNNMKADHILTIGLNNPESMLKQINKNLDIDDNSTRLKNIQLFEEFFKDIERAKSSIVFVSDKNYNLKTSSFAAMKGFGAERPTLENLGGVLSRAGMSDVDDMIFALANTGNMRFNTDASGLEKYLATKIANFLFDDVVITDQLDNLTSSVNRIHVFNLGNIYVPLSVLLQGVYSSLTNIKSDYTQYVNVKYSAAKISYKEQTDGLDEGDWSSLYNEVITSSHVAFHFFGNFMNFVKAYL